MSDARHEFSLPADRVVIERHVEPDGAEVYIVSDEGGEFARAGRISDALHYASDLLHGPGTGPRGTVWNMMRAIEDTGYDPQPTLGRLDFQLEDDDD